MSQITIDDLKHFWMPSGVPCFVADRKDICDIVEQMGFQIYYLISNQAKEIKSTSTTTNTNKTAASVASTSAATSYYNSTYGNYGGYGTTKTYGTNAYSVNAAPEIKIERKPQLFKVVNNFVGRTVTISTDNFPQEFVDVEEECTYTMPFIPRNIIDKLDEFFRLVHSQHGTESIVILTYDTTKEDSSGWGVLVPEQTNTPAHCKYDADSIAAIKPDHVMIVGSVHSHPEMSAYASGTDHEDQADFDGIHITYGWQKSVQNGATQYHIELQMAGKNYKLDVEDVFEPYQLGKDPDPEVVEWSGKVKKALPPQQGGFSQSAHQHQTPYRQEPHTQASIHPIRTGMQAGASRLYSNRNYIELLDELKLPKNSLVMIEVDTDNKTKFHCPSCECEIDSAGLVFGRCDVCEIPLVSADDSMPTICEKAEDYIFDNHLPSNIPVYFFGKDNHDNPMIMRINEEIEYYRHSFAFNQKPKADTERLTLDQSDYVHLPSEDILDGFSIYEHDEGYMVCCGVKVQTMNEECYCVTPIFLSDLLDFDKVVRDDAQIYASESECHTCAFYYEPKCPAYREILTEYTRNSAAFTLHPYINSISGCSNYTYYREVPVSIGKE
jgi:uncharacterized protein (UPF0333 family)